MLLNHCKWQAFSDISNETNTSPASWLEQAGGDSPLLWPAFVHVYGYLAPELSLRVWEEFGCKKGTPLCSAPPASVSCTCFCGCSGHSSSLQCTVPPPHSPPFPSSLSFPGDRTQGFAQANKSPARSSILSSYSINQSLHTVPSLCLYFKHLKMFILIYVHVCVNHMYVCRCPWRPKEGDRELEFIWGC